MMSICSLLAGVQLKKRKKPFKSGPKGEYFLWLQPRAESRFAFTSKLAGKMWSLIRYWSSFSCGL